MSLKHARNTDGHECQQHHSEKLRAAHDGRFTDELSHGRRVVGLWQSPAFGGTLIESGRSSLGAVR